MKINNKINYISYTFIYLVYSSVFVFLNSYFPILFFEVLDINRYVLAFIQFLAYSIVLLRPVFAVITDKYRIKGYQRKYYIISSGYLFSIIYIFMGLTFSNILVFSFFLLLIFFSGTMLDVSTKSLIIDISPTNEVKKRAFFFRSLGVSLGRFFPFFLYFLIIHDVYSVSSWTTFFISSFIFILPIFGILPFINEKRQRIIQFTENSKNYNISNSRIQSSSSNSNKTFILLCIFKFFAFSDVIFAYSFFPYVLTRFGINNFNLFNFILIFYFIISLASSATGTFLIKKKEPKKIIFILIPIIGIIYILYTVANFMFFTILYLTGSFLIVIVNLNITIYILKFKKGRKSRSFHYIETFRNLSILIFLPLGTVLSNFISFNYLIIIGAVLLNFSLIPLKYIKN